MGGNIRYGATIVLRYLPMTNNRTLTIEVPIVSGKRVDISAEVCRALDVAPDRLPEFRIILLRRSVDARKKDRVRIVYSLQIEDSRAETGSAPEHAQLSTGSRRIGEYPVVVGTGPSGLFAAYALALKGYKPVVLERGGAMPRRIEAVHRLWRFGVLDESSNVQFGEGGAGTFSDGKLTCRSKDPLVGRVFDLFVECGAHPEIHYEQKPHVGTEKVRAVVCRLRNRIRELGGTFHYDRAVTGLIINNGAIAGVEAGGDRIDTDAVFLATGHSARDTYEMLHLAGVALEPKAFAVGLRIEHSQELIDRAQYGRFAGHPELGAADYRVAWQDVKAGRGVYSFCNCPGGVVVAAASEPCGVVTNGMSRYGRDSGLSNSAIVVSVNPSDFRGDGVLAGIEFQRRIERAAFEMAGGGYLAPAQKTADFMRGRASRGTIETSYTPGVVASDVARMLPGALAASLRRGIDEFAKRIKGFKESVLVGPETRTSSPVRVPRRTGTLESVNVTGLFPIGEGAGYAGGIVSSAVDGLKAVDALAAHKED